MASPAAEAFRRFIRSVFDTQAALLKHGDVANADLGQSSPVAGAASCVRRGDIGGGRRQIYWLLTPGRAAAR